jgi:hypothetical protein
LFSYLLDSFRINNEQSNKDLSKPVSKNKSINVGSNNNGNFNLTLNNNTKKLNNNNNIINKNLTSFNFRSLLTTNNNTNVNTNVNTTENEKQNLKENKNDNKIKQDKREENNFSKINHTVQHFEELNVEDLSTIIKNLDFKHSDLNEDNIFKTDGNKKYNDFVKTFSTKLEDKYFSEL